MINRKRFSDEIADAILKKIKDMGLGEGDRLPPHSRLAKELNVSIPSLREGLQTLSTLGIIKIQQGVGTIIVKPDSSAYLRVFKPLIDANPLAKEEIIHLLQIIEEKIMQILVKQDLGMKELNDLKDKLEQFLLEEDTEELVLLNKLFHKILIRYYGNNLIKDIVNLVVYILFSNADIKKNISVNKMVIVSELQNLINYIHEKKSKEAKNSLKNYLNLLGTDSRRVTVLYDTFGTGSIGGSFYAIGSEICQLLRKYSELQIDPEPTEGGIDNIRLTEEGRTILGLTQSDVAFIAYNGLGLFSEKNKDIRAICTAPALYLCIIVKSNSGISSLKQLKGKRIAMGCLGGDSSLISRNVLGVMGFVEGDYRPYYLSLSNAIHGLVSGELDAIFYLSGGYGTAISDLGHQVSIQHLSIPSDKINNLISTHTYWFSTEIVRDKYPYLKNDETKIMTLGVSSILITHKDVPERLVYKIVATLFSHVDEINEKINGNELFSLESALKGISIPLHQGSIKYFKEKGLL